MGVTSKLWCKTHKVRIHLKKLGRDYYEDSGMAPAFLDEHGYPCVLHVVTDVAFDWGILEKVSDEERADATAYYKATTIPAPPYCSSCSAHHHPPCPEKTAPRTGDDKA